MCFNSVYECFNFCVYSFFFCVCIFFSLNFQYTKKENHFKLVIIYYSFCVLADDAISNLAKRPYIKIKSEDRHAAYCFKTGPSLYPENTIEIFFSLGLFRLRNDCLISISINRLF